MNNTIKLAIPTTGRLAEESLEWLSNLGIVETEWAQQVIEAVGNVKKHDSESYVKNALLERWQKELEGVTLKYDLRSGWRIAFSAKETEIEGEKIMIYGSEPPTINDIRQGIGEIAIIGFDDLMAAMIPYVSRPGRGNNVNTNPPFVNYRTVKNWEMLNGFIERKNSTDVRVIGSTSMQDYAGLFLMVDDMWDVTQTDLEDMANGKKPVYVKGRNEGLAYYYLGNEIDAVACENIEDIVSSQRKSFGLDIVRTGKTVQVNNLKLVGEPVLVTKSVVAVDINKYNKGFTNRATPNLPDVVFSLQLERDTKKDYESGIPAWRSGLEKELRNAWATL
jgi:hypothetical protein